MMLMHNPMNMGNAHNPMNMNNAGNPHNRPDRCSSLLKYSIAIILTCLATLYMCNVKHLNYFSPQEDYLVDDIQKVLTARDETARMVEEIHQMFHDNGVNAPSARKGKKTCERWNTDCIGTPDYALESSGASIITTRNTIDFDNGGRVELLGWVLCGALPGARAILQPDNMPGNCWAFTGCEGTAVIRLVGGIYINSVSIEHVSKAISPFNDVSTAPKQFRLYALGCADDSEGFFLGEFVYDIEGPPIQCFYITQKTNKPVQFVEVKFLSNNGHPDYTCVYKIRIHGDKKKPKG